MLLWATNRKLILKQLLFFAMTRLYTNTLLLCKKKVSKLKNWVIWYVTTLSINYDFLHYYGGGFTF